MFLRLFIGCIFNLFVFVSQMKMIYLVNGYLLDEQYPILISEKAFGDADTLFGASVSLSKGPVVRDGNDKPKAWVFIGAPRSNSTDPTLKKINEPGVIWRCSLGQKNGADTCDIVNIDPIPEGQKNVSLRPASPAIEDEGNSWIGGSVEIKNGRLVACGPRYTRGQRNFISGICYYLLEDTEKTNYSYHAHVDEFNIHKNYTHRLIPLFSRKYGINDRKFDIKTNGNTTERGYEYESGEAGLSHHITNESGINELLIGAPGVRQWSGAIVRYRDSNKSLEFLKNYGRANRDPSKDTYAEYFVGVRGTKDAGSRKNRWYDYFGYGVSAGKYFQKDRLVYVGGAPRASNLTGQVIIFEIPSHPENISDKDSNKHDIKPILEIYPEGSEVDKFGSYFGSVLLSIDLDEDGRDELLVGAPMYTISKLRSANASTSSAQSGDHGCVFVYFFNNMTEGEQAEIDRKQILCGNETAGARFGSAISYIRMSNDKTDLKSLYIVIGAPYEDEGRGAIYIYSVKNIFSRVNTFSQRIGGKSISNSILGFGWSISLPEDIDGNETPDVAVGAHLSKQVVVLRTRPRIKLSGTITFLDPPNNEKLPITATNVKFKVCVAIGKVFGEISSHQFKISSRLIVDTRLLIGTNNSNGIESNVSVSISQQSCVNITAKTDQPNLEATKDDSPIKVTLELWYEAAYENGGTKLVDYIIRPKTASRGSNNVDKNAGNSDFDDFSSKFPSSVDKTKFEKLLHLKPNDCAEEVCNPELILQAEWFNLEDTDFKTPIHEFHIKSSSPSEILLRVLISNEKETAVMPEFNISWSKENEKIALSKDEINKFLLNNKNCDEIEESTKYFYKCRLPRNVIKNRTETHVFKFDLKDVFATQPESNFSVVISVQPTSDKLTNLTKWKNELTKYLTLKAKSTVRLIGSKANDNLPNPFVYNCTKLDFAPSNNMDSKMLEVCLTWRQTFSVHIRGSRVSLVKMIFKLPWSKKMKGSKSPTHFLLVRQNSTEKLSQEHLSCEVANGSSGSFYYIEHKKPGFEIINRSNGVNGEITSNASSLQNQSGQIVPKRRRRRRDILAQNESQTMPKEAKIVPNENTVYLHCNDERVESSCIVVNCEARNVKGNSYVDVAFDMFLIKSAVDELLEEEENWENKLLIESTGWVEIFSGSNSNISNATRSIYTDEDVAQTRFSALVGTINVYIYIMSIIGGFFQLALIVFILFKCGFFEREAKKQLRFRRAEEARVSVMKRCRRKVARTKFSFTEMSSSCQTQATHVETDVEINHSVEDVAEDEHFM